MLFNKWSIQPWENLFLWMRGSGKPHTISQCGFHSTCQTNGPSDLGLALELSIKITFFSQTDEIISIKLI